ncbi:MAG: PA2169 family four-helix-bundle protein [Bacteroidota bacterium]|nr:PA2169 family four-helix-bundle protein [Bacteroidota bacterium]
MENSNDKLVDVLNDLVQINNDRIEGYQKAIEDTKSSESDYDSLFNQMITQSSKYKRELINEINSRGGNAERDSTTNSGKIYRMWMDVKSTFAGKTGKSALELSEFGEDAAQKAYDEALKSSVDMPAQTRELLVTQKDELKHSHDLIKAHRDMEKAKA